MLKIIWLVFIGNLIFIIRYRVAAVGRDMLKNTYQFLSDDIHKQIAVHLLTSFRSSEKSNHNRIRIGDHRHPTTDHCLLTYVTNRGGNHVQPILSSGRSYSTDLY